ncbi:WD40 repeat-like protein [Phlegmacium glaucopus]|nr:WD40 repeat-like protein [Phlegmacium glaucopus]
MLPSPTSSPILSPCTNTLHSLPPRKTTYPPTPPPDNKFKKRQLLHDTTKPQKRLKLDLDAKDDDSAEDEDVYMESQETAHLRARQNARSYNTFSQFMANPSMSFRRPAPSTLPILRSFVSSNKSDLFKCQSVGDDTYLTPPYACAFSHGARNGGIPTLAVATEQGTVHILNTSKRNDWDVEPSRTTMQTHHNGIFDIKWSLDDASLATCSGDQSTRISCTTTGTITHVLRGHSSTIKCMAWDPSHTSLLATGGRDGVICLWDLRVSEQRQAEEDIITPSPVMSIYGAHEDTVIKTKPKPKPRNGKQGPTPRTVTNLLYPESQPFGLVSSSSFDGILQYWDLRIPTPRKKGTSKPKAPLSLYSSPIDPTTLHGSRRSRGIISLTSGSGPSAGLLFALGADSRIHTYDLPSLAAQRTVYTHDNLQANSFYVGLSMSPCGRWLASGGSGKKGSTFLFDVGNASRPGSVSQQGSELKGQQTGEVGGIDWARNMLATCIDDGTVRVWRPDLETYLDCIENPEERRWDWTWSM